MPDYELPKLTLAVDLAILTVRENLLQVLVIERGIEPYRGQSALPGWRHRWLLDPVLVGPSRTD